MKSEEKPVVSISLECKKIAFLPCLKALAVTIAAQVCFLAIFIIQNFDLLHPIKWFLQLFGFHWLKHLPLLLILLATGLVLTKRLLGPRKKYYPNRFKRLLDNGILKLILMLLDTIFGLLTAWSIITYSANSSFYTERNGISTLNSQFTFLSFIGVSVGIYYFINFHLRQEILLQFEFIPKPIFIRIREAFVNCFWTSAKNSILPTIVIAFLYWVFGSMINNRLALLFGVLADDSLNGFFSIMMSVGLIMRSWLIIFEFLMVMHFMEHAFSIFLTAPCCFPISKNLLDPYEVSLVIGLSMNDVPIVQKLAALDFYNLAKMKSSERREEIYALSQPGGHPYNWNQLCAQCLSIINSYIDELNCSLKSFPETIQSPSALGINNGLQQNAMEMAQRILIRQYNEKHNIRRLKSELEPIDKNSSQTISTVARINENFNRRIEAISKHIVKSFKSLPGLFYMFGEPEGAKLSYLLSDSDLLIWIVQGIAHVCVVSLTEDPYGVVQLNLPEITKTLLKLKKELDRISFVNLNTKTLEPNLMPLKNAVKRSLHMICNAFQEYLCQIVEDPTEVPSLQTYLY